jgi:GntR family transcriptional regulator, transcriptional repressor for pyruvate dehydrogenase complex
VFEKLGSRRILSYSIQEQIEAAIQDRTLTAGDRLPTELELCEQFGVSRTVMREALRGLSAKGLLSIEKGRGMFIKELTASFVVDPMRFYLSINCPSVGALDVIQARQAMEPAIAAMAALHRTTDVLQLMHENLQIMIAKQGDPAGFAEIDSDFHLLVAKASNNPIMPLVIEPIRKLMPQISLALYNAVQDAMAVAVGFHTQILHAIEAKKEETARRGMSDHLKKAEQHIRLTLERKTQ